MFQSRGGRMKPIAAGFLLFLLLISPPALAIDGAYSYTDIHPEGWLESRAVNLNARGEAAGFGRTVSGERGFLWSGGKVTEILPPGMDGAKALWVNDSGEIAGTATIGGLPRAFLYRGGEYLDPTPGWAYSEAVFVSEDGTVAGTGEFGGYISRDGVVEILPEFSTVVGINTAGQILGTADNSARLYLPGKGYLDLLPPGASSAVPRGINESGLVAVSSGVEGSEKGYVYSGGFFVFMTPSGWSSSSAMAINGLSQVVGYGEGPCGRRGFLRTGADYVELSFPGWSATEAASVNDAGQVAGSGTTADGQIHAFLASPAELASASAGDAAGASAGGGCSLAGERRAASAPEAAVNLLALALPGLYLALRGRARRRPAPAYSPMILTRTRFRRRPSNSP